MRGDRSPPFVVEKSTFPPCQRDATLSGVAERTDQRTPSSLHQLREERGIDQTLQNLLRALTLNLELRARYRVFEFEAVQDGHPEIARLFRELRTAEGSQIAELVGGLQGRFADLDLAALVEGSG
jgi:hypothetical protein